MKKMNNKGFSLVELIIVIAIMAILAGAIAPALIRYIDKSRKSNDVSSGKTIKTAVETAMGNEVTYELLTNNGSGSWIQVTPSKSTAATGVDGSSVSSAAGWGDAQTEIFNNIGEKTPKIKYKKNNATNFYVVVSSKGTVSVWIGKASQGAACSAAAAAGNSSVSGNAWELAPDLDKEYQ